MVTYPYKIFPNFGLGESTAYQLSKFRGQDLWNGFEHVNRSYSMKVFQWDGVLVSSAKCFVKPGQLSYSTVISGERYY